MKTFLFSAIFTVLFALHGGYVNTELLYSNSFRSAADLKEWKESPEKRFRLGQGTNGSGALYFRTKGYATDWISLSLDPAAFRGKIIQLEAVVKAKELGRGTVSYHGPKVMLHYTAGKNVKYLEPFRQFGSYGWQKSCVINQIPENCDKIEIFLGIQGAAGEFWVDSVRIYECRESDEEQPPPMEPNRAAMAIPRGGNLGTRYRGVMSGNDLSPAAFETLAEWNVNLVRYQMNPAKGQDVSTQEKYLAWIDNEIEKIDSLLSLAEKHGIKLIIDLHRGPGTKVTQVNSNILDSTDFDFFAEIWRRIATRFRGNRNIYAYDLLNEPINNSIKSAEGKGWQQLAEHLVKAIRAIDPDTSIIVEPFAGIDDFTGLQPIRAKNIIYSPHFYQPFSFTHQGIHNKERWSYPGYINGIYWDKEQLRVAMESAIRFQRKHNVPIFVGEFSAVTWSKGAERYIADTIELLEEYGWDWVYHAFRESVCWNVELEPQEDLAPWKVKQSVDNPRKKVLLQALRKNRK